MPRQEITFTVTAESQADLEARKAQIKASILSQLPWVDPDSIKITFQLASQKLATSAADYKVIVVIEQSTPVEVTKEQIQEVFNSAAECDSTFLGGLNVTKIEVDTDPVTEPPPGPGASSGGKTVAEYKAEIEDLEKQLEEETKKYDDEKKKRDSWMIVGIIFIILFGLAVIGIAALIVLRGGSSSKAVSPA